ncbi:uncharacterized protein N7446_013467 [Penicillium canescens]|uniref:uncharacterized protein n=1 Tax=Penicillium canescens TaxID=5083 RepID=UPI0026DFA7C7|nr:uncharacterized protein N7446_013467 [Penicillium canescens]KAJ6042401.1 hypothetical protein N7446_013467 [Penicillium canescens]
MTMNTLPLVRLPEPWKTTYELDVVSTEHSLRKFQLRRSPRADDGVPPPKPLHHASLMFTDLAQPDTSTTPDDGNNSGWARAQRSPITYITWSGSETPTVGQIWNVVYAIETLRSEFEIFRAVLSGEGNELLARELQSVGLAMAHPEPSAPPGKPIPVSTNHVGQLVFYRSSFWQGAGSPFGTRPAWVADPGIYSFMRKPLNEYPTRPRQHTVTTGFPERRVHAHHPVRSPKPAPGSRIYSRYIPHLNEFFSVFALDYTNDEHLRLFNTWQNDPRVAQGWNETGTLDQHRQYLRTMQEDPHQIAVLAKFNDTFFSYHELYWTKEDHLGAYYDAGDWDRGRHSLVGNEKFRGSHRTMAWWSSLMHYIFLDEPRTDFVTVLQSGPLTYDHATGMNLDRLVDLPHKRSALILGSREKFFHVAPVRFDGSDMLDRNPFRSLKL